MNTVLKGFFSLLFLAALGAGGYAWKLRGELLEARQGKDSTNRSTLKEHAKMNDKIKTIGTLHDDYAKVIEDTKIEEKAIRETKSKIAEKEEEVRNIQAEVAANEMKKVAMEQDVRRIVGPGLTVEEVLAKREALKSENENKAKEVEAAQAELALHKTSLEKSKEQEARFTQLQASRKAAISLGGRTGTIGSVNPDYGFCVVNMGTSQGVTMDSRLIVKRGSTFVTRLKIVQITGSQTVADFRDRDLNGNQILPGDQVIFDNGAS